MLLGTLPRNFASPFFNYQSEGDYNHWNNFRFRLTQIIIIIIIIKTRLPECDVLALPHAH